MIVSEVKVFAEKKPGDIPCNIIIDGKFLEDKDDNETNGCIGGFKMYAKYKSHYMSQKG